MLSWTAQISVLLIAIPSTRLALDYDTLSRIIDHPVAWLLTRPLFWAMMGVVFGPYVFWRGLQSLRLKRLIKNIPRSTIRAAALGPIEVVGKAVGPYTLVSPLANSECLYYRLVVLVGE